jgi:23S rRNA pseudouridine1911/1915/1917 synthase
VNKKSHETVFENGQLIAVNKPSGLLAIPDRHDAALPSLQGILTERYGKVYTVHRLDKDTSGLILFAKDEATHRYLSQLFEQHRVQKWYSGIVLGQPAQAQGSIDAPIAEHPAQKGRMVVHRKGKQALTDYTVEEKLGPFSLLRFRIHTGRTHQIRVHAQHIGHPIACDPLYGNGKPVLLSAIKKKYKAGNIDAEERPLLGRLGLHASELQLALPDGSPLHLSAPLPKDMAALLQQLRKNT